MRVFACLPKSINFQGAGGRAIGLPFLWLLSLEQTKKVTRALTLESLRSEIVFVRETTGNIDMPKFKSTTTEVPPRDMKNMLLPVRLRHLLDVQILLAIGNFDFFLDKALIDAAV